MNCSHIFEAYKEQLVEVESALYEIFSGNATLLQIIGKHIIGSGGKRLRPLLLILSAELCGFRGEAGIKCAAIIEAIHTASLLHDDVIDFATTRRGKPSANKLFGNQVVILVGDYLYSNSLRLAVAMQNQRLMQALAHATTTMTEGEILQMQRTADPEITDDEYFAIISAKTGALMACACAIGAILAGKDVETEARLADFGMKLGITFQLADDVLDYTARQDDLGKKLGKDLEEGKITMPLIHLLKSASEVERAEISDIIKSNHSKSKALKRILALCTKYDAIAKSMQTAQGIANEAKAILEGFEPCPAKEYLNEITDYALKREK